MFETLYFSFELGPFFLPIVTTTFTNRALYWLRLFARPVLGFFFSWGSTLGVCPFTLPARARDPWTLPPSKRSPRWIVELSQRSPEIGWEKCEGVRVKILEINFESMKFWKKCFKCFLRKPDLISKGIRHLRTFSEMLCWWEGVTEKGNFHLGGSTKTSTSEGGGVKQNLSSAIWASLRGYMGAASPIPQTL